LPHIKTIQNKYYVNNTKDNFKYTIPKFVYFHTHWYWSTAVVRQKIKMQPLYDLHKELVGFGQPDWTVWNEIINNW